MKSRAVLFPLFEINTRQKRNKWALAPLIQQPVKIISYISRFLACIISFSLFFFLYFGEAFATTACDNYCTGVGEVTYPDR
jgi:hypothetical protein